MSRLCAKPWTPAAILELIRRKRAGEFADDIAAAMGRSEPGIKTRWRIIRAEMIARGLKPPVGGKGVGLQKTKGPGARGGRVAQEMRA